MVKYTVNYEEGSAGQIVPATTDTSELPQPGASSNYSAIMYDSTQVAHGNIAVRHVPYDDDVSYISYGDSSSKNFRSVALAARAYFYFTAPPTAAYMSIYNNSDSRVAAAGINVDGNIYIRDSTGIIQTGVVPLVFDQWLRIEIFATSGSEGDATIEVAIYEGDSVSPIEQLSTSSATTSLMLSSLRVGKDNYTNYATPYWVDSLAIDTEATGLIGPISDDPVDFPFRIWDGSKYLQSNGYVWKDSKYVPVFGFMNSLPSGGSGNPPGGNGTGPQVGALPVGEAVYEVPSLNTVFVSPSGSDTNNGSLASPYKTIARAATLAPAGSTIVLREGVYHEGGAYTPGNGGALAGIMFSNNNITVQNYPGEAVWLDGSESVAGWTESGGRWSVPFITGRDRTQTHTRGDDSADWPGNGSFVNPSFPYAAWPEMVFFDGVSLEQVGSLEEVGPGKFFVQGSYIGGSGKDKNYYTSSSYVIGDDPAGHDVRISTISRAMTVGKKNITIRGIGFRRYSAALCEHGTVYYDNRAATSGAVLENVVVEDIANVGIHGIGNNTIVRHCTFMRCGNTGFSARADDLTIEYCYFKENVSARYNYGPHAGAIKITMCQRPTVRHNRFEDTYGHAFWADMSVYDARIYSNDFIRGYGHAVNYEISALAYIVDNLFVDVAVESDLRLPHQSSPVWISGSDNVYVWNNTFVNSEILLRISRDGRSPLEPGNNYGYDSRMPDSWYETEMPWTAKNVHIKNNIFYKSTGINQVQASFISTSNRVSTSYLELKTGGNLYNRLTSTSPLRFANGARDIDGEAEVVTWFEMAGNDHLGGPSWVSVTGESGSVLVTGRDVMETAAGENFVVKDVEANVVGLQPLPAGIASKVERTAGVKHLGAWR